MSKLVYNQEVKYVLSFLLMFTVALGTMSVALTTTGCMGGGESGEDDD